MIPLSFQRQGNSLSINSPINRNIAPPGHYMLFILNNNGVPSEAAIVRVGQPALRSGQQVSHKAKAGRTYQYAIESANSDKVLSVAVNDHGATTRLQVTGSAADGRNTAVCDKSGVDGLELECKLSVETQTRWLVEITPSEDTRYNMTSTLSTVADPQAIQPAVQVVRTGGGAIPLSPLLLSLLLVARQRLPG